MKPQPDDTRWPMVLDPGPDCRCSRCHAPILDPENLLRVWSRRVSGEYRYHQDLRETPAFRPGRKGGWPVCWPIPRAAAPQKNVVWVTIKLLQSSPELKAPASQAKTVGLWWDVAMVTFYLKDIVSNWVAVNQPNGYEVLLSKVAHASRATLGWL